MNPIKYFLFFFLFLSICLSVAAQTTISGVIIDAESGEPVPFASISHTRQKIGTSANMEGYFILNIQSYKDNDLLEISSLGYEKVTLELSRVVDSGQDTFKLKPQDLLLEELVVTSDLLSAEDLVTKAAEKLKRNYSSKPYIIDALYEETLRIDGKIRGYTGGSGFIYMDGYSGPKNLNLKSFPKDVMQWKQTRRSDYLMEDQSHDNYMMIYKLLKAKDYYLYNGPITKSRISDYSYSIDSMTVFQDQTVFIVYFKSNDESERGKLLITDETFMLLQIELEDQSESKNYDYYDKELKSIRSNFSMTFSISGKSLVLNRIAFDLFSRKKAEERAYEVKESAWVMTGQFDRSKSVTTLNQAQKTILFYDMINPMIMFREDYWEQYPIEHIPDLRDLEDKKPLEVQFNDNSGQRLFPLPNNYSSYDQMYKSSQLFDMFFRDF